MKSINFKLPSFVDRSHFKVLTLIFELIELMSDCNFIKTYISWYRAPARAAPLWPNSILFRAGGKPSTRFPPETRRAEPASYVLS